MRRLFIILVLLSITALEATASCGNPGHKAQAPDKRPIEIQLEFVEFNFTDIEKLILTSRVDINSLSKLLNEGKGKLIASPSVITKDSKEAITKEVLEVSYATDLKVDLSETDPHLQYKPTAFEVRETGVIVNLLPELSSGGEVIRVFLSPEITQSPRWKAYDVTEIDSNGDEKKMKFKHPFFSAQVLSSTYDIAPGSTILAGGGIPRKDKRKLLYIFLTADFLKHDKETRE